MTWNLALVAVVGLGAFLVGYWLIPFYVDPAGSPGSASTSNARRTYKSLLEYRALQQRN